MSKEVPFSKSHEVPPDPLETRISAELWRWSVVNDEERRAITDVRSELSIALEFYLCGVFHRVGYTRSRGIWCDGVMELKIKKTGRRSFLLVGVGYFPGPLAPFEIEFHYAKRRDLEPVRVVVRFGELDSEGEVRFHANAKTAEMILMRRPRRIDEWAVAVELVERDVPVDPSEGAASGDD